MLGDDNPSRRPEVRAKISVGLAGLKGGRMTGKKHSEETKNKISLARKKYLKENGENPWKYKSSVHSSIPCEKFKSFLKKRGIDFS